MKDLLWFALNGERLIVLTKRAVHVFDCQDWNCVLMVNASFIGLSKDETLIAVSNRDNDPSIWNVVTGEAISVSEETSLLFADDQRIRLLSKRGTTRVFIDIFTCDPVLQLQPPQLSASDEAHDIFDEHFFRFPNQPYIFQSTFSGTAWGESMYLWCYDIHRNKWLFHSYFNVGGTPRAFISPYQDHVVVARYNTLMGYDLKQQLWMYEGTVNEDEVVQAIAFYPQESQATLIAGQNSINRYNVTNETKRHVVDCPDVVSLSVHPQSDIFCALMNSDLFFNGKLCVFTLDGNLLRETVLTGFV